MRFRRGQTRRRQSNIRWGGVFAFILTFLLLIIAIGFVYHMLSGNESLFSGIQLPGIATKEKG